MVEEFSFRPHKYRCFWEPSSVRVAPLTFLVGDNSSGKSAFLAGLRAFYDTISGSTRNPFNDAPFSMGSFNELASYRGGKAGRAKAFGFSLEALIPTKERANKEEKLNIGISFEKRDAQPFLTTLTSEVAGFTLNVEIDPRSARLKHASYQSKKSDGHITITDEDDFPRMSLMKGFGLDIQQLLFTFDYAIYQKKRATDGRDLVGAAESKFDLPELDYYFDAVNTLFRGRPFASAPIRTSPERTYNVLDDQATPDGAHIPLLLRKAAGGSASRWKQIHDELVRFGTEAGLFDDISIRKLGRQEAGPFQVEVKSVGRNRNLMDVGYGVSQALPIVVEALVSERPRMFLVQQPEVHLHPVAQAALGSFLVRMVRKREHRFIVETHSDFLIDRSKREIFADNQMPNDNFALVFFEKTGIDIELHNIDFDLYGMPVDPPASFRQFFLEESERNFLF
jgi:predicted ATPase